jgi:hypothetical protein
VLDIHLKKASRRDYGLRSLAKPHTDTPTEDGLVICPDPACGGLVLQGRNHYENRSVRVQEFDNSGFLLQLPQTYLSFLALPHLTSHLMPTLIVQG